MPSCFETAVAASAPAEASDLPSPARMERVATGLLACSAVEIGSAPRAELEAFTARRYQRFFGAQLGAFLPHLLDLRCPRGSTRAALGYRSAAEGRLFVEDYLDAPAQLCVAEALGMPVQRETLVEVGNLAADPGLGRAVVATMTLVLRQLGFRHVLFAATGVLRASFGRLGLAPVLLASADPSRLRDTRSSWGSYYEHRPQVLCGDLSAGLQLLLRRPELVEQGSCA